MSQLVLVEVAQQALQGGVGQHALVAVLGGGQHVLQLGVVRFDGGECLVQCLTDVFGAGNETWPTCTGRENSPLVLYFGQGVQFAQSVVCL